MENLSTENSRFKEKVSEKSNKQFISEEDMIQRALLKDQDLEATKDWLNNVAGLKDYIKIPEEEMKLAEYYEKMDDVEVSPDIKEFWGHQKEQMQELAAKMDEPKREYLNAYKGWQNEVEAMDDRKRDELGLSADFDYKEKQAKESIKDAKLNLAKQKRAYKAVEYQVNPFQALLGWATGYDTESIHKKGDAKQSLKHAHRSLRDARRRLREVQESRDRIANKKDKISAKQQIYLQKMNDAQERMDYLLGTAQEVTDNVTNTQSKLHEQYALIDKYKSIETFKKSGTYSSARKNIKENDSNKQLIEEIDKFPEILPKGSLKVTLNGPLQISKDNKEKLEQLSAKVDQLQDKLPSDLRPDPNNPDKKIDLKVKYDEYALKQTDTVESLQNEMDSLNKEDQDYDVKFHRLEMKRDHLALQNRIKSETEKHKNLVEKLKNFEGSEPEKQELLKQIQASQDTVKILQTELAKDQYSQTIGGIQELQSVTLSKEKLEAQEYFSRDNFANTLNLADQLDRSQENLPNDKAPITISETYHMILDTLRKKKDIELGRIEEQNRTQNNEEKQNPKKPSNPTSGEQGHKTPQGPDRDDDGDAR